MTWMEGLPAMVVGDGQGVLLGTTIMVAVAGRCDQRKLGRERKLSARLKLIDRNCLMDNVRCENLEAAKKVRFLFEKDCVNLVKQTSQVAQDIALADCGKQSHPTC
jgi:hypothetical protein